MKLASEIGPEPLSPILEPLPADLKATSADLKATSADLEGLPGTIACQFIRCGKPGCRCLAGEKHGPYHYRMWREGSKVKKAYIPQANLSQVLTQCALHQSQQDRLLRLQTEYKAVRRGILCQTERLHTLIQRGKKWDAETKVG